MHKLYELKENLIKELEGYADSGKYSKEDVQAIKYMASAVDHICNIMDGMDEEYSGYMPPYYDRGRSYADAGSYGSYAGRRGAKRDAMGRYSRASEVVNKLTALMDEAPDEKTKHEIQKLIDKMETM